MDQQKNQKPQRVGLRTFGTVSVPGTRAGAIVSLGLVILAWIAIPVARPHIGHGRAWSSRWPSIVAQAQQRRIKK